MARRRREEGSALVEAAILFPCVVLILFWSTALTDVLVLKLGAAEAVRYALWETTVFKRPAQIDHEVEQRFAARSRGLLLYPPATPLAYRSAVDSASEKVSIRGDIKLPAANGLLQRPLEAVVRALARSVDAELQRERFNVHGKALARVALSPAVSPRSRILPGGDLPGLRGGGDLGRPRSLDLFATAAPLASERPMQLVFDTWKAWPKPAEYTFDGAPSDVATSPMRSYPVVEEQVSAQVDRIAFFGVDRQPWFGKLRSVSGTVMRALGPVAGGTLPDVFSAERMDGPRHGPVTILPPEPADAPWVPQDCDVRGRSEPCATQRLGDVRTARGAASFLDDTASLGHRVDRTRYTLPYRINTPWWTQPGGTNAGDAVGTEAKVSSPPAKLTTTNEYVKTYRCRGHFFAGSRGPQQSDPGQRYARSCYQ